MLQKTDDGNGGKWIVKKKFTFAAVAGIFGSLAFFKGVHLATTVDQTILLIGSFTTFASFLLGIVFAADIVDKKANGGTYNP
jgi:hypothetical protein